MPTEHSHIIGGSSADRRLNCIGSLKLEKQMPEGETSEFAERGSMLHAAMELILTAQPEDMAATQPLLEELEGQNLGFEGHEITRELIETKLKPALLAWFKFINDFAITDYLIEQQLDLGELVPGAFGTADIVAVSEFIKDDYTMLDLHILDWKFGDGVPVSPVENLGLGFYAVAALVDEDATGDLFEVEPDNVWVHIVQPADPEDDCLESWEAGMDWVESVEQRIVTFGKKIAEGKDDVYKSGKHCRWCRGKIKCPEQSKTVIQSLEVKPKVLTAMEIADYMEKAKILEGWIRDLYAYAQDEMERGVEVPGWKLVPKRAVRRWKDPEKAEDLLRKARLKVDQIFDRKLKSPAAIEKAHKKLYHKRLASLVESKSSGLTVVPESDKRVAVTGGMDLLANALSKQETGD